MNVEQRQAAADHQAKPPDLGCESACYRPQPPSPFIMRPSSLGGGRILRRTLSVCLSVRLSVRPSRYRCHR